MSLRNGKSGRSVLGVLKPVRSRADFTLRLARLISGAGVF